jgi:predicted HD phosphohydrolase
LKPDFSKLDDRNIVAFLGDIFARCGAEEYLGEPVTMAEHMLQGAVLAEAAGASDEIVAAALLHDIGHFTHEFPSNAADLGIDSVHEDAGAAVLEPFFPPVVTDCVRHHVAAKRYLCGTDQKYLDRLSSASIHSLFLQGGPMGRDEATEFRRNNPNIRAILQVRIWDDAGKEAGKPTPDFAYYAPVLQRVVDRRMAAG